MEVSCVPFVENDSETPLFRSINEVEASMAGGVRSRWDYLCPCWARPWTFQQDGAPFHKSNVTQRWLLGHFPDVININQWPAAPDLNPIELVWGILKPRVNAQAHPDVQSLIRALGREWGQLSQEEINNTIEGWPARLDAMLEKRGDRFEKQ